MWMGRNRHTTSPPDLKSCIRQKWNKQQSIVSQADVPPGMSASETKHSGYTCTYMPVHKSGTIHSMPMAISLLLCFTCIVSGSPDWKDSTVLLSADHLNNGLWFGQDGLGMYIVLVPGQNFSCMDIRKCIQWVLLVCVVISVVSGGAHQKHACQPQRTSARYCLNCHILHGKHNML